MGPAEILLCVLLHFTRIRSFEVGVHSKQDASKKYREGAKEIDEIFYNSPLVVIMITSIKFHKVDWKAMIIVIWVDPVYSAIWYIGAMW